MTVSAAAQAAAFKVVDAEILNLANTKLPFFVKGQALQQLQSAEGVAMIKQIVLAALMAAEGK